MFCDFALQNYRKFLIYARKLGIFSEIIGIYLDKSGGGAPLNNQTRNRMLDNIERN